MLAGGRDGRVQALQGVHFGDAHGRSCPGGLDEHGVTQPVNAFADGFRVREPLPVRHGDVRSHLQAGGLKNHLHVMLVHPDSGREDTGANVAGVREFQQSLDGAVFTERAVKQREDNVHGTELLRNFVRGRHDQLVFPADFGECDSAGRGRHLG
ncbi:hypothetical protein D9M72_518580 [compost metagenome]